jgi:cyanophycinase
VEALESIRLLSLAAPALHTETAAARQPLLGLSLDDPGRGAALAATQREHLQARREALVSRLLANHPAFAPGRVPARADLARLRALLPAALGRAVADAIGGRNADIGGVVTAKAQTPSADGVTTKGRGYELITFGNAGNVDVETSPGMALVGGGTDVDEVFRWMGDKSTGGDFLVLRASGTGAYNSYIDGLASFDSVTTLIMSRRSAAFDEDVLQLIRDADAVFLAGGDQADYVRLWADTDLEDELLSRAGSIPIGGTSAGLAVLGETDFAALNGSVTSAEALSDPYGRRISLDSTFLALPGLDNVITDSHFVTRDRMGRLVTFLARTLADGGNLNGGAAAPMLGIGINEQTALLVEPSGSARVVSNLPTDPDSNVYLVRTSATLSSTDLVSPGTPLSFGPVTVYRAHAGDSFDLDNPRTWRVSYTLMADAGSLSSSSGNLYA